MSAICLFCTLGTRSLANPLGTTNDPMGCCKICHSLACGSHGQRNGGKPAFECVICVPPSLIAAASTRVQTGTTFLAQPRAFFDHNQDAIPPEWTESLDGIDDWKQERSLIEGARSASIGITDSATPEVRTSLTVLISDPHAKLLIIIACMVVEDYEIASNQLPDFVNVIINSTKLMLPV